LDGEFEIFEGIELIVSDGHTIGQQLVKVSDGDKTLVYCGDLIPTSSHIPIPYVMAYDLQPLITMEEKKETTKKGA
jgi:glyoxylase-like metal-dependent hydrolase (beta-lactamase superfamily II)